MYDRRWYSDSFFFFSFFRVFFVEAKGNGISHSVAAVRSDAARVDSSNVTRTVELTLVQLASYHITGLRCLANKDS
jgi:hypothetical protein